MFGEVGPLFQSADLATANLEHSLSLGGSRIFGKPTFHRGKPDLVEGLVEAGFDALTIANNHILDYGEDGLWETVEVLNNNRIPFTGAGHDLEEAAKPIILERNGFRVGILAYTSNLPQGFAAATDKAGVNPLNVVTTYRHLYNSRESPGRMPQILTWTVPEDLERMRNDIRALKPEVDAVLVNQHWGTSMMPYVHDFQREIGRAAIEAGADLVFGGHQHVLAPIEFHLGKPILHCTGNLIFDKFEPFFTDETYKTFLFGATLIGDGLKDLYLVPCRCGVEEPCTLLHPDSGLGAEIVDQLGSLCEPYGTRLEIQNDRVNVTGPSK